MSLPLAPTSTGPEIPGLSYHANQKKLEDSGFETYTKQSNNPNIEQMQKDLLRSNYVVCFGDKTFDSVFLGAVFSSNVAYTSRNELVKKLQRLGLTTERIEQQLTYLQEIFDLPKANDFKNFIGNLGKPDNEKLRQTMLKNLFYAITADPKKAECLFQLFSQAFTHHALVEVIAIQLRLGLPMAMAKNPDADATTMPTVSQHFDRVGSLVGKLNIGADGTMEFISPSAVSFIFMDEIKGSKVDHYKLAGTTTHTISIDTVQKQSFYTQFTASNKVSYLFGTNSNPPIITHALLNLAQAEENLNQSLSLRWPPLSRHFF